MTNFENLKVEAEFKAMGVDARTYGSVETWKTLDKLDYLIRDHSEKVLYWLLEENPNILKKLVATEINDLGVDEEELKKIMDQLD